MTWVVSGASDLPIDTSGAWDGAAAEASIWEAAGFNGDSPDPAKAARAFFTHDTDNPTNKGSYKLPFAHYANGKLTAVAAGIRAAASRLSGTDGPDDGVKNTIRNKINAYEARFSQKSEDVVTPEESEAMAEGWNAALGVRALPQTMTDDVRSKLRAYDPSIFDEQGRQPFLWSAEASSDRRDGHRTRMHISTLENYAEDARNGVAFLNSHNMRELPMGYSYDGQLVRGQDSQPSVVKASYYTVPGLKLGSVATDDLIAGMRAGLIRDVSAGFYGGKVTCSVCERSIFHPQCEHIPGINYPMNDSNGRSSGQVQTCEAWIKDAHMGETSATYKGSTPRAMIEKISREVMMGRMMPETVEAVEMQYRIHVPVPRSFGIKLPQTEEEQEMPNDNETPETEGTRTLNVDQSVAAVGEALKKFGIDPQGDPMETIRRLSTAEQRLTPDAELGRQYRKDLIEEAMTEGVRAYGNEFKAETYRSMLEGSNLEMIKVVLGDFRSIASGSFKPGRQTEEIEDEPKPEVNKSPRRDAAYIA